MLGGDLGLPRGGFFHREVPRDREIDAGHAIDRTPLGRARGELKLSMCSVISERLRVAALRVAVAGGPHRHGVPKPFSGSVTERPGRMRDRRKT